jgi:hypothetical protein
LLDALLAYGSEDGAGVPQGAPEVAFSSFGMGSRMVLVAPAPAEVLLLSGKDVNRNYWKDFFAPLLADKLEEYRQDRGRRKPATAKQARPVGEARELKRPFYEDLLHIDPAEIDFDRTRLIWVPSWAQPDGLVSLHARLRENQNLLHVASYDEALAMTRMNFGVAILPQIYSKRKGVTTFRLPEDRFTRWIGAYYSTRFKLTRETYHLLTFVRKYVQEFMAPIRDGEPAAFHHAWFQEFCERLTFEDDWCAGAARDYPLKPARTGSGGEGEATS